MLRHPNVIPEKQCATPQPSTTDQNLCVAAMWKKRPTSEYSDGSQAVAFNCGFSTCVDARKPPLTELYIANIEFGW
jgi:hypothetical protein